MRASSLDELNNFLKYFVIGCLATATIPFFVTVLHLYNEQLFVTPGNVYKLHRANPWYMVLDAIPLIAGIAAGILGDCLYKITNSYNQLLERQMEMEEGYLFLQKLLEESPIACLVVDKGFNLKYVNQGALDLTSRRREDALGKKCFTAMGATRVCSDCAVARALLSGRIEKTTRTQKHPGGKSVTLLFTAVPLFNGGNMMGVMEVISDITEQENNARERKKDMLDTIETLVGLIELKDSYTGGHSQRVRTWAVAIAKGLNLSPEEIEDIEIAACLHDIGKIGISGNILNKPDKLSEPEYESIKRHPLIGEITVRSIERLINASKIIRHHHESVNGTGYPDGLFGEEIPLGARVICVADAYDAMMSDRAYRTALGREKAMAELRMGVHQQFDKRVVDTFLSLLKESH